MGMRVHPRRSGSSWRVFRLECPAQTSGVVMLPWAGGAAGRPESVGRGGGRGKTSVLGGVRSDPATLGGGLEVGMGRGEPADASAGDLQAGCHRLLSGRGGRGEGGVLLLPHARFEPPRAGQQSRGGVGPGLVRGRRTTETSGLAAGVRMGGHGSAHGSMASERQRPSCATPREGTCPPPPKTRNRLSQSF